MNLKTFTNHPLFKKILYLGEKVTEQSHDQQEALEEMIEVLEGICPHGTFFYMLLKSQKIKSSYLAHVFTQQAIGKAYLDKVEAKMLAILAKNQKKLDKKTDIFFKMEEGKRDDSCSDIPDSVYALPLYQEDQFVGVFCVSRLEDDFTKKEKSFIKDLVTHTEHIIQKVNQLVDKQTVRFKELIESMDDGLLIFDRSKKITLMNRSVKKIFDIHQKEISLGKFFELTGKRQINKKTAKDLTQIALDVISQSQKTFRGKIELTTGIYELSLIPLLDHNRQITGGLILIHDITASEEASKNKSDFVKVAAHKLRTPLTNLRWNIEMLLAGDVGQLNKDMKEMLESMGESNINIIKLIDELLLVSEIDKSLTSSNTKGSIFNPISVISKITHSFKEEIKKKQIKVEVIHQKKELEVYIDKNKFIRVLEQLVSNAIIYNKAKGKITIETKVDQHKLIIKITDTGIGIETQKQRQLFKKFYRTDRAMLAHTEGSGLGLFLTKVYVESWGGKVKLTSKIDQGTSISFTVPLKENA